MRVRLDLPDGQLAAVASVLTFGDYLNFHPHLHVLAATGLVDRDGRFQLMPLEKRRGIGGVLDGGEAEARRGARHDEIEPSPEDWWRGDETPWEAPELPLEDGQVLVLDADTAMPRQRSIEGEANPQSLSEAKRRIIPFPPTSGPSTGRAEPGPNSHWDDHLPISETESCRGRTGVFTRRRIAGGPASDPFEIPADA